MGALDQLVAPAAGAGVGVYGASFQGRQRELGRHEHGRAERENDESQQCQQRVGEAHRVPVESSPGRAPGRLEEGSASGSASGSAPAACGTGCLSVEA